MELGALIEAISNLSREELKRVREAAEERRERLYKAASLSGEALVAASCSLSTAKTPKPEREGVPTGNSTTGRGKQRTLYASAQDRRSGGGPGREARLG